MNYIKSGIVLILTMCLVLGMSCSTTQTRKDVPDAKTVQAEADYNSGLNAYEIRDYGRAYEYFLIAAEQGHAKAQFMIGQMYLVGYGVLQNDDEAMKWFSKAGEKGIVEAQIQLGDMYKKGRGPSKNWNRTEALKWYEMAAEQGNAAAQMKLSHLYLYYRNTQDLVLGYMWYEIALANDNTVAEKVRSILAKGPPKPIAEGQYKIGLRYIEGKGVLKDKVSAYMWLDLAAANGLKDALKERNSIAGSMTPEEIEKAKKMVQETTGEIRDRQASIQSNNSGLLAFIAGDYETAHKEFLAGAQAGDAKAQFYLGFMYHQEMGIPQDYKQALKWFRKAAEQGHAKAQFILATMYYEGHGIPQDYKKAVKWYQKAADQGYVEAQPMLGTMYFMGFGVSQDYVQAYKWINIWILSSEPGSVSDKQIKKRGAIKIRDKFAENMTPAQIAEAEELAHEWLEEFQAGTE